MSAPKKLRGPKGRVMYCNRQELIGERSFTVNKECDPSTDRLWTHPVAVIPASSAKAAREIVKLHAMSEVALQVVIAEALAQRCKGLDNDRCMALSDAVLSRLGLKGRDR